MSTGVSSEFEGQTCLQRMQVMVERIGRVVRIIQVLVRIIQAHVDVVRDVVVQPDCQRVDTSADHRLVRHAEVHHLLVVIECVVEVDASGHDVVQVRVVEACDELQRAALWPVHEGLDAVVAVVASEDEPSGLDGRAVERGLPVGSHHLL